MLLKRSDTALIGLSLRLWGGGLRASGFALAFIVCGAMGVTLFICCLSHVILFPLRHRFFSSLPSVSLAFNILIYLVQEEGRFCQQNGSSRKKSHSPR
jgi:hypothetical protein